MEEEKDLKKEATDAFNQTKEEIKNINVKEEVQKGKGLLLQLVSDPIGTIKEIAEDENNKFYKTSLVIIAIWLVVIIAKQIINKIMYKYASISVLTLVKSILTPICKILVMSIIILLLNKNTKHTLTKTISAVVVTKIPVIISSVLGILTYISSKVTYITSPIGSFLSVLAIILEFFVIKELFNKEDNKSALSTFVKVEAVYYIVAFALSFLDISI